MFQLLTGRERVEPSDYDKSKFNYSTNHGK